MAASMMALLIPLAQAAGRHLRRGFRAACCVLLLGAGAAAPPLATAQATAPAGAQAPARAPAPDGAAVARATTRVVVLSDFNESYGSVRYAATVGDAVRRTVALRPDLVISTGDMIAGQRLAPPLSADAVGAMWQAFHQQVTEPLARAGLPFAVTPGNHDASSGARFALERDIYRAQWAPRKPALDFVDASGYPFQYAFRVRGALFVSLDATFVGHLSAPQKQWLDGLLQAEGQQATHRVVFTHVPLWPFAVGRERDYLGDPELDAILQRGRVGLFLSGHHHAYYPGWKDGVRHVSQGCLGAAPRPLIGTASPAPRTITVIELGADGTVQLDAYGGAGFDEVVPRSTLPPRITAHGSTLLRDDLAPAAR
jgi:3',5'-cyclic AMP phosphodiesterase CpdA